jgi:hypothetical protein
MSKITLGSGTLHQYTPSGQDIQSGVHLNKLSDVTLTNVQNNQILKYDSTTSQFINTSTGAVTTLDSLSDVTITAVSDGQSLQYNSTTSQWENRDITANSIDGGTY